MSSPKVIEASGLSPEDSEQVPSVEREQAQEERQRRKCPETPPPSKNLFTPPTRKTVISPASRRIQSSLRNLFTRRQIRRPQGHFKRTFPGSEIPETNLKK
ncbi:hypothetical protein DMENIID0001_084120 [Sergentomyia squamirostris]